MIKIKGRTVSRETFVRIIIFALTSAFLMSLYAISNTLLYKQYMADYAVFKTMGSGWAAGLVPFRDLFDHKGPFVYVIQLLGAMISTSKAGLWILEWIWVVVSCELMYRCGRYVGASKGLSYLSVIIALMGYACFVDGGNAVEIWSLPFEVLPLLLILRYLSGVTKLPAAAFVSGLCFGIVAMTRLNNNAMIVGLVIGMMIYLCYRREFIRIFYCAGWFLTGLLVALIPFVVYFMSMGALEDFIYCVFTFNMLYMEKVGTRTLASVAFNAVNLFPCMLFLPVLVLYARKKGIDLALVLAPVAIVVFLTFCAGIGFLHYFLMTLPVMALSIQMLWPLNRYFKVAVVVLYLVFCGHILKALTPVRINNIKEMRENEARFPGVAGQQFISDFIPDGDKRSVYIYGDMDPAAALDANGYLPVGKYFFLQEFLHEVDPEMHDDIIRKFRAANPKWILAKSDNMSLLEGYMGDLYVEIPADSLPASCPESWHVYLRKN